MLSFLYGPTLISIHDYWKTIALTRQTFVGKVMSLLFLFFFKLYNIVLVLPYIEMNPPQAYMFSPS